MKKRLAAAAAAIVLALSMTGCVFEDMLKKLDHSLEKTEPEVVDDSSEEDIPSDAEDTSGSIEDASGDVQDESAQPEDSSSFEELDADMDDSRFIANARAVVSSWFDLMSAAQYTDAFKLCTEDFVSTYYPDGLVDGENISAARVSYYDGSEEFDIDELGRRRVKLKITIIPENYSESEGYIFVVYSDGQFLISGLPLEEDELTINENAVYLFAKFTYDTANIYKDMIEPGIYETGDGSYLDQMIPEYTEGGRYVVYVGENGVELVQYTANGISMIYPEP